MVAFQKQFILCGTKIIIWESECTTVCPVSPHKINVITPQMFNRAVCKIAVQK